MKAMKDGWFVIVDSNYRTPSVFDLQRFSRWRWAPQILQSAGTRIVANDELKVAVEFRYLVENSHQYEGKNYTHMTRQGMILLSAEYGIDLAQLGNEINDVATRKEIISVYEAWSKDWLPKGEHDQVDVDGAKTKIANALREAKKKFRAELKRRNANWISARLPAIRQKFTRWPESSAISEDLFAAYEKLGGGDTEASMLKKVAEFYTVCFTTEPEGLERLDGKVWQNEEEIWDCWLGFVGGENEANILLQAMEQVFRTLQTEES